MRFGDQEPTYQLVSEHEKKQGEFWSARIKRWGIELYPAQAYELELMLARDGGAPACKTLCITKPRQNGKSFAGRLYVVIMGMAGKKVLYTCHNGSTTRKMFQYIAALSKRVPDVRKRLDPSLPFVRSAGNEGVYFANGGCIEFQTRTNSGALGTTYDVIVVDEAQELTYEQLEVIKPTTIAAESGEPQMVYVGTPPVPKSAGDVFADYHDQAHAGVSPGLWWLEWSATEVPADMTDEKAVMELAYRCNPAMGYRIKPANMLDAIRRFRSRPDSFARMYLCWWTPQQSTKGVIDKQAWLDGLVKNAPEGKTAFGVKVSADGAQAAVCAAALSPAGVPHVELAYYENISAVGLAGIADMVERNADKAAYTVVDGKGAAEVLIEELKQRGLAVRSFGRASTAEAVAANAMLVNATRERALTHLDDPVLTDAATLCTRRSIGHSGGFGFEGEYATALEAAALAVWAVRTTNRDPERTTVIW